MTTSDELDPDIEAEPRRARTSGLLRQLTALAVAIGMLASLAMLGVIVWGGPGGDPPIRPAHPPAAGRAPAQPMPSTGPWGLPPRTFEPLPNPQPQDGHSAAPQDSPLNRVQPVTLRNCPSPQPVATLEQYRDAVRAQWSCVHRSWVPVLERLRWPAAEPEIVFFNGTSTDSECGHLEAPAFYCSAGGGTAYFGSDHFDMAAAWRLSINEMVNHEYGHHLQNVAGITAAKLEVADTAEAERRAELQATCWSAMMTWHNEAVDFGQQEWEGWLNRLNTMLVDGVHGSRDSLLEWGTRGFYARTLGDCNTWLAAPERVN